MDLSGGAAGASAIASGSGSNYAALALGSSGMYESTGDLMAQSSVYDPVTGAEVAAKASKKIVPGKRDTVIRKGNGKVWEDTTLVDWDPSECEC